MKDVKGIDVDRGVPIVLSAPSGGGKSTISAALMRRVPDVVRSISCTTRTARPGEKDGRDYFFVSRDEFQKKIDGGEFLEWATVHGNYYGTPVKAVTERLLNGKDVLLVIDPQGAVTVRKVYPEGLFIFVVPPTWDELERRLRERGTDGEETRRMRIANAEKELTYLPHYDYLVTNDGLDEAVDDVCAIVRAHRLRLTRRSKRDIPILEGLNESA